MASGAVVLVLLAFGARVYPAQQSGPGIPPRSIGQPYPQFEAARSQSTASSREHTPEDEALAARLYDLAEVYRAQGRYADAVPLYQRARSILRNNWVQSTPAWRLA